MMRYLVSFLFLLWSFPVLAASEPSPEDIVRELYQPYLDQSDSGDSDKGAQELIYPWATSSLQRAIDRGKDCEKREQGVCTVEADIIANGQDWQLTNLKIYQKLASNDKVVVQAKFNNYDVKMQVDYIFIKEKDQWRIDEIKATDVVTHGKPEYSWALKETLMQ